jgi:CDP-diacylglycerol--serine O-phosphatidyltransferase
MNPRNYFIISLSWIDLLTLGSLLLSCLGLSFAFHGMLTLAIALMLLSMFVDMLDGLIARRMKLESEFGKYLDSFCDVFTYLVLPLFILFQFGMRDALSITALFAYLACGLLRLSRFNIIGTIEDESVVYHLGLLVIWSHLVVVLAFPAWWWLGEWARFPLAIILLVMSIFMIRNLRFPEPTRYMLQAVIILSVSAIYFYLHFIGIFVP